MDKPTKQATNHLKPKPKHTTKIYYNPIPKSKRIQIIKTKVEQV